MHFKKLALSMAMLPLVTACQWEDKYAVVDCDASADSSVVDCRSESAVEAAVVTQPAVVTVENETGNVVSFERDVSALLSLTATDSQSWSPTHADQIDLFVRAADEQVLVGSKYHNYLRSFQSDNAGQLVALDDAEYLEVTGDRYVVDALTGATEQVLNGLSLSNQSGQSYVLARADKYDDSSDATGVGLYIEALQAGGVLPERDFATGGDANFIGYGAIRAAAINPDGASVAVAGSDRMVKTYAFGSYDQEVSSTKLNIRGSSLAYSADDSDLYVGGLALMGMLVSLDANDLSENWQVTLADKPIALLPASAGGVVAVLASGNNAYWLPADGDESGVIALSIAAQATSAAINADGTLLALGDTNLGVEVISLASGQRARIDHGTAIQSLAFDGFGTVWVIHQGGIQGYQLPAGFE